MKTQSPQSDRKTEPGPTPALVAAAFTAFAKGREGMSFARAIIQARVTTSERSEPCRTSRSR
jgi:hypothetical protein